MRISGSSWNRRDYSDYNSTTDQSATFNDIRQRAIESATDHTARMVSAFADTYFKTMKELAESGPISSFQMEAIRTTQNVAGIQAALPVVGGILGGLAFGPMGIGPGAGGGAAVASALGSWNQLNNTVLMQEHQQLVISQSMQAMGVSPLNINQWTQGMPRMIDQIQSQSIENEYNKIRGTSFSQSPTGVSASDIQTLARSTSNLTFQSGNPAVVGPIVEGWNTYERTFPFMQGTNAGEDVRSWFVGGGTQHMGLGFVPDRTQEDLFGNGTARNGTGHMEIVPMPGQHNVLDKSEAGHMARAVAMGRWRVSPTLMLSNDADPNSLVQQEMMRDDQERAKRLSGEIATQDIQQNVALQKTLTASGRFQSITTSTSTLIDNVIRQGLTPEQVVAGVGDSLIQSQSGELAVHRQIAAKIQNELTVMGDRGDPGTKRMNEALLTQEIAKVSGLEASISQSRALISGTMFSYGMGQAGIMMSGAELGESRARLVGGPSDILGIRGQQYSALEKTRTTISDTIHQGDLPFQKTQELMAQYNEVLAQQITLQQRSIEEFHGLNAAISSTRAETALGAFSVVSGQGGGPLASVSAGGASMGFLRSSIGDLQQRADARYAAIVASGGDPNTNQEYLQMQKDVTDKQLQLVGTQNNMATPGLSANSRLTTAGAQFQMRIAQMLPGTGVSMFASYATIANQANRNITDINAAYHEAVRQNGGVETDEMRYRHQMQVMEQMETQVGAISAVTTGIEGRMFSGALNPNPNMDVTDASFSRRAAYGAGFKNVPFYTGMGSRGGKDLREYGALVGRMGSNAGSDATPGQWLSSELAGRLPGSDYPLGSGGILGINGGAGGTQNVRIDGPLEIILVFPDGTRVPTKGYPASPSATSPDAGAQNRGGVVGTGSGWTVAR